MKLKKPYYFFLYVLFIISFGILNSFATSNKYTLGFETYKESLIADTHLSAISASNLNCDNIFTVNINLINTPPAGDIIGFYFDQNLTQRITDGLTQNGSVYTITNAASQYSLNITNLTDRKVIYAARIDGNNNVVTAVADAPSIVLVPQNVYNDNMVSVMQGCGSVDLGTVVQDPNLISTIADIQYYYGSSSTPELTSATVTQSGTYVIKITTNSGCVFEKTVTVTIAEAANVSVTNSQVFLFIGETFTINASSANGSVLSYFDVTNNRTLPGPNIPSYNSAGNYIIRVDAKKGTCTTSEFVYITVDSRTVCKEINQRIYANKATPSSWVNGGVISNVTNAANSDTQTFATITVPLGLLGLARGYIDLEFANPVPAGKSIIIKLGTDFGGIDLLSGGTVTALTKDNNDLKTVGSPESFNANLLGVLNGDNEFEFTFTPKTPATTTIYGVRILITSLLSVRQSLKVYNAYYISDNIETTCQNNLYDVLSGTKGYGVTLLTSSVGVENPRYFNDGNDATFTRMYVGIGVLAEAYLTPVYSNYSAKDDIIELIVSKPNGVIDLTLLGALTYRKFDRDVPVSELTSAETNILSLTLLSGTTDKYVLRLQDNTTSSSWDRFELRLGGVASVLNFINIYSIKRLPKVEFTGLPTESKYTFCKGQELTVIPKDCTTYKWYSQPTGTNSLLSSTGTYQIPQSLLPGTYTYYVQAIRNNCEVLEREAVTFTLGSPIPAGALSATNTFNPPSNCAGNVTLTATATITPPQTLTNPYYEWYKLEGGNQVLQTGQSSNTLNLINLPPGNYTYFVGIGADEFCISPAAERVKIDFIVPRLNTSSDFTTSHAVNSCNTLEVEITANSSLTNVVYKWYFDVQGNNEILNGTVNGITYTIQNNKLLIDGLPNQNTNLTYYATLSSDQTCLNTKDLRRIDISYQPEPQLDVLVPGDQQFCKNVTATLADIRLNYSDIDWYANSTGGTILPLTTQLTDNTTYYAIRRAVLSCPVVTRLAVKVVLDDISAPVLPANQTFCITQNATVSDLLTNNYNIVWKDVSGNIIAPTTPLVNGNQYYGHTFISQGCESAIGTMVTVAIANPIAKNEATTLVLCSASATQADLVNFNNAAWYYDVNQTNLVPVNATLQNGATYYSTKQDPVLCETTSYATTVTIVPDNVGITELSGDVDHCLTKQYTFTATQGFLTYNWTTTDATIISGGSTADNYITLTWNSEGQHTVTVEVDNLNCIQTNFAQITQIVIACQNPVNPDLAIGITASKLEPNYLEEVTFTITLNNLTTQVFTNVEIDALLSSGFEYKSYSSNLGTYNQSKWLIPTVGANETVTLSIVVKVLEFGSYQQRVEILSSIPSDTNASNNVATVQLNPIANTCLIAYNEISPNGDGLNDFFEISCINNFPNTKLEIYNRYGNLVYKNNNYDNSFNGYANVAGTFSGKELASGTYFYTLQFPDGITPSKSGWLYIMR